LMMNPVPWLQMTNMISYQGLVRTFLRLYRPVPVPVFYEMDSHITKKNASTSVIAECWQYF
ncbi:hypothetical protein PO495_23745, partial [Escherichia coli]